MPATPNADLQIEMPNGPDQTTTEGSVNTFRAFNKRRRTLETTGLLIPSNCIPAHKDLLGSHGDSTPLNSHLNKLPSLGITEQMQGMLIKEHSKAYRVGMKGYASYADHSQSMVSESLVPVYVSAQGQATSSGVGEGPNKFKGKYHKRQVFGFGGAPDIR